MSDKKKKRFIAGATCPKCKELDSLMLYWQGNIEQMECVSCGYHQSQTSGEVEQASRQSDNIIGVFKPD